MGEEDAVTVDQNSYGGGKDSLLRNRLSSPLPPPPHLSSKVLTLPTVLTLGRVAAVPILVASTFSFFGSPIMVFPYTYLFGLIIRSKRQGNCDVSLALCRISFQIRILWFRLKSTLNTDPSLSPCTWSLLLWVVHLLTWIGSSGFDCIPFAIMFIPFGFRM